ncbi:hypothetical protein V5E97_12080 [Singulisphaera sp. Ch08]|uniref:Integron gene cassette protein n=1 Tax=Singulisphaera sp. Ch08 TaxID=3120278 RepID=A0AAU7CMG7_9BACT
MALVKRGKYWHGDAQADIQGELIRYSKKNYLAQHFAEAVCTCGSHTFRLCVDDTQGVAVRVCTICGAEHPIGDSDEYLADAELEECECPCGRGTFEITVGVALYDGSDDVRWLYIGCRCLECGLTACYGDWKNEFEDYRELLRR